jgi:hypothetical protein
MNGRGDGLKISVEVCDVCGDRERAVRVWRFAPPGGRVRTVALCREHEQPLLSLPDEAPKRPQRKVVPREQVEGKKRRKA